MQPLTPSERREIERIKNYITEGKIVGIDFYGDWDNLIDNLNFGDNQTDKELWLKVLSMALEHNEAIEKSWRELK